MTDKDRKFLTEAMGECWHEWGPPAPTPGLDRCVKCDGLRYKVRWDEPCTFTTWADFGAVWGWAQKQEWWSDFKSSCFNCFMGLDDGNHEHPYDGCSWDESIIDPVRFSQLIVDFLRERDRNVVHNCGADSPIGPQHLDHNERFFQPK